MRPAGDIIQEVRAAGGLICCVGPEDNEHVHLEIPDGFPVELVNETQFRKVDILAALLLEPRKAPAVCGCGMSVGINPNCPSCQDWRVKEQSTSRQGEK